MSHGILWGSNWPSPLRQTVYEGREEAWYELSLHAVLRAAGVACPAETPLLLYDEEQLPAATRGACQAHLSRYLKRPGARPSAATAWRVTSTPFGKSRRLPFSCIGATNCIGW